MAEQTEQFQLVNAFEQIVVTNIQDQIAKQPDMCTCEKCFKDICAIVFNKGFVRFVTTPQGALMAKLPTMSNEKRVALIVAIQEAIELVKSSPQH